LLFPNSDCSLSFHHNLFAQNSYRNPLASTSGTGINRLDWRNNVIYNWSDWAAGGGTHMEGAELDLNMVGNYYIANRAANTAAYRAGSYVDRIWQSGNKLDLDRDTTFDGTDPGWGIIADPDHAGYTAMSQPFNYAYVPTDTADAALLKVLGSAGASRYRDAVDQRVVQDVYNNTGSIIDSQWEVGGWPWLPSGTAPLDTDQDGMPDYWEDQYAQYGLSKYLASDRNGHNLSSLGYTNLEVYLD
jgi:hypothetical protein